MSEGVVHMQMQYLYLCT